ncbi:MAG: hypothetical protein HW380_3123 [Magnetococcales bacterium]|nr:hypothetical protein [Magnetococcales bacterium]
MGRVGARVPDVFIFVQGYHILFSHTMLLILLTDAVVCFHLLFVAFVLGGGFLVLRWPWLMRVHIPCTAWGAIIEIGGWICPLTYLENHLRYLNRQAGYSVSFVEHYLLPMIYPDLWFPGGFPPWGFTIIGCGVLLINGMVYFYVWQRNT